MTILVITLAIVYTFCYIMWNLKKVEETRENEESIIGEIYSIYSKITQDELYYLPTRLEKSTNTSDAFDGYTKMSKIRILMNQENENIAFLSEKYEETFQIVLSSLNKAKQLGILTDNKVHENINPILDEVIKDLEELVKQETHNILRDLNDEVEILKELRKRAELSKVRALH